MAISYGYALDGWSCPIHHNGQRRNNLILLEGHSHNARSSLPDIVLSHNQSPSSGTPGITWCRRRHAYVTKKLKTKRERTNGLRCNSTTDERKVHCSHSYYRETQGMLSISIPSGVTMTTVGIPSTNMRLPVEVITSQMAAPQGTECSYYESIYDLRRRWIETGYLLRRISDDFRQEDHENIRERDKEAILNNVERFVTSSFFLSFVVTVFLRGL